MEMKDKASLIEKVNISNNKVEEIILNKSDKNIIIKNSKNNNGNLSFSKKSTSPPGRIRAYKNKYNSPEISRLNQNDKNKAILDINTLFQNNYNCFFIYKELNISKIKKIIIIMKQITNLIMQKILLIH